MTTSAEKLIADLHDLVSMNPAVPVSFQLPDGTPHVFDPQIAPYLHRGVIVVPIMEVSEAETYDDEYDPASRP